MKTRLKAGLIVLVALAIVLYTRPAFAASPPVTNDSVAYVDIHDFYFNESSLTIRPPNTVTGQSVMVVWHNYGIYEHSVTSGTPAGTPDGIIDQNLTSGATFSINITETIYNQILAKYSNGVLPYYCAFHYGLGMTATLTVTGTPIPEYSLMSFLLAASLISAILLKLKLRRT